MVSSQLSLLEQVKQGDAKAIAGLLNQKLQPKGIETKAATKNGCLHIMLESTKTPPQKPLVEFIRKVLQTIEPDAWQTVKVYGRRAGEELPDWLEELNVGAAPKQDLEALAKQGDVTAIATLTNQSLQAQKLGITAKISLKGDCLQVMLEAAATPDQPQMVSLLTAEMLKLAIQPVTAMKVYGKQVGEDFPDWHQDVDLTVPVEDSAPEHQSPHPNDQPLSETNSDTSSLVLVEQIDGVKLSNQLYTALQTTCYQHLNYKVTAEDDKTIHEIVAHFIDDLEAELKLELDQFAKQAIGIIKPFGIQLELANVQSIVSEIAASKFSRVRLAIRDLERVTQEVLQTDFPQQETNALKGFFTGAAQEFTANLFGRTTMSTEAVVGAVIGTVIAPGIGSAIGGAIGGWFGGNKQQKALQAIIEKYQKARGKLFQEWEALLEVTYDQICDLINDGHPVKFLTYQGFDQAIDLYNQGNSCLENDSPQEAIDLYSRAIDLNPEFALAWNNIGYVLIQLGRHEEALLALAQAIKIDNELVIAFNNCGDALQGLGKHEEAISAYEESIKLDQTDYSAWWGRGFCLYNLQQYEEVIRVCDRLIALSPENFSGWYVKASCQSLMGHKNQALESLEEAVKLNPNDSQNLAVTNTDFDCLRNDERFKALMESSVGVSYATLKKHLKKKQWKEADQETALLMKLVVARITNSEEINQDSLKKFPLVDLATIDRLWQENSNGKFGFSMQKEIFGRFNKDRDKFGDSVGWRIHDDKGNYTWRNSTNFDYNIETAPNNGHLPSSLWAGEDGWFENRRDRLIALFARMEGSQASEQSS